MFMSVFVSCVSCVSCVSYVSLCALSNKTGTCAGISITIVGHPFDTLKVRLQTQNINPGPNAVIFRGGWDCFTQTVRKEGPLALYRGMGGPMATVPLLNAVVFAFYEQGLSFLRRRRVREKENGTVHAELLQQTAREARIERELRACSMKKKWREPGHELVTPHGISPDPHRVVAHARRRAKRLRLIEELKAAPHDTDDEMHNAAIRAQRRRIEAMAVVDAEEDAVDLRLGEVALAGGWAGLVNTVIVGPVELVKSRLQVQYNQRGTKSNFAGPSDVVRDILKHRGPRGLFLGMNVTAIREVPAYMAQFGAYEWFKRVLTPEGSTPDELGPLPLMMSGAMAGVSAWIASYPQDVIKSRIQIQPEGKKPRYKPMFFDGGSINCAREIYRASGIRGFFVGFGPCVARALPANAAGFLTYELVSRVLRSDDNDD
jgi:Mitochondrial carrier protein